MEQPAIVIVMVLNPTEYGNTWSGHRCGASVQFPYLTSTVAELLYMYT